MRTGVLASALLLVAAVGYAAAAWQVAPGFFDGFAPAQPYRWVSPPPGLGQGNQPPLSVSAQVPVQQGVSQPAVVMTPDGQAHLIVAAGAFKAPPGTGSVGVRIDPERTFPTPPPGVRMVTNVYRYQATAPLQAPATMALRFSVQLENPTDLYRASPGGGWTSLPLVSPPVSLPFSIAAQSSSLGYFAAGYPVSPSPSRSPSRGPPLPLLVAAGVALLMLAVLPLVVLRRRQ